MKNIVRIFIKIFLLLLFLTGCGTADSVSNSSGPSSPSGIVMNLEVNPASVPSGGTAILTVTLTFNSTGVPASGYTVFAVNTSGDSGSGVTDSNGQTTFTVENITVATTATATVEDISASIRINVNA